MKPKISLVTLGVTDFQKSLVFYRDGFSSYCADPDGYLCEVAHNPFTDLT